MMVPALIFVPRLMLCWPTATSGDAPHQHVRTPSGTDIVAHRGG